ncbi:Lrp/AsnC family transcriptional regulator [Arenibaculum pallidiluteum]|uniref:Lrp/AsnC family transcriptional regulator n=1 Tax=Arenibaculum pallidiluteum TaxID=2812559 RepID=UPI001A970E00|nr:Lrp/AsnC family transcriptional regulator [Arenibaculum pallidiluteum]
MRTLDPIDRKIIRLLRADGRMSNARLAAAVGLSQSACLRRLHQLEHAGVIRGYTALVAEDAADEGTLVLVQVTLDRQTEDALRRFEIEVRKCPEIQECHLLSGSSDYLLRIATRTAADYDRIHKDVLSRLPGVARLVSSFAIRCIVARPREPADA